MTPLLLGAAGLVALMIGGMILRTFGAQYRIGRLLATTPRVSVAEANRLAAEGRRVYVRIDGRIDAADEFEDADHRPLVFRRVRLEAQVGRDWRPFEDHRQAVPFQVNEGLDSIGIDVDSLGAGVIVVPRESIGRAADLAERAPDRYGPETPVRVRIEQVSSVEHAIALGYPVAAAGATSGQTAHLTAGRRRPLILSVLEPPEAMRILAAGGERRTRWAAGLLGAGAILIVGALAWALVSALLPVVIALVPATAGFVTSALAASPEAPPGGGGDPRSDGQGPGLVGSPGVAILAVVVVAAVAVAVTTLYVRLTEPNARDRHPGNEHRP